MFNKPFRGFRADNSLCLPSSHGRHITHAIKLKKKSNSCYGLFQALTESHRKTARTARKKNVSARRLPEEMGQKLTFFYSHNNFPPIHLSVATHHLLKKAQFFFYGLFLIRCLQVLALLFACVVCNYIFILPSTLGLLLGWYSANTSSATERG